ncbi:multidrug ABC transporter substrate-binding protein [Opitutaceae bacterium EW11]|nr:multidrug ABC transporter substrate-binding protein [Opitutaceae bacterium EW11]
MRITNTTVVALRALRRSKLRSILTALGIIIGVGAVIAMVSIGNGAKSQVEAQVASLGQNVITVFPGSFSSGGMRSGWGGMSSLTPDDAEAIGKEVANVAGVSPEVRDRNQVLANGLNWNTQILGEGPDYPTIRMWPLQAGAMFTDSDVRSMAKVAVIGETVAEQLYPNEDPIGQTIRIRNIPFKVVGVLASKGFNLFGQDQDDVVLIPYSSHMRRVSRRTYISSILVQAASAESIQKVQDNITDLLLQRRRGKEQDFTVRNQVELAEAATATSKTMTVLLGAIAGVSLVVGGIGIMNIMLVSVTERTREIGIRLAVGAHGRDVLLQFLIEAVILSSMGGIIGILLGIGTSRLVSLLNGWPVLVSSSSVIVAFVFSAVVGVFFGFYPARKAAQLDPIDALRYE